MNGKCPKCPRQSLPAVEFVLDGQVVYQCPECKHRWIEWQNWKDLRAAWKRYTNGTVKLSNKDLALLEPFLNHVTSDMCMLSAQGTPMAMYLSMAHSQVRGYLLARKAFPKG